MGWALDEHPRSLMRHRAPIGIATRFVDWCFIGARKASQSAKKKDGIAFAKTTLFATPSGQHLDSQVDAS